MFKHTQHANRDKIIIIKISSIYKQCVKFDVSQSLTLLSECGKTFLKVRNVWPISGLVASLVQNNCEKPDSQTSDKADLLSGPMEDKHLCLASLTCQYGRFLTEHSMNWDVLKFPLALTEINQTN